MTDKNRETEMDTSLLIGGAFEAGTGPAETVLNPRTGEAIVGVAEAESSQIDRAVAAARAAFAHWSRTTFAERSAKLLAIADAIDVPGEARIGGDFGA